MNLMRKKHQYCGKSMSTNFPGYPHTMSFVGYFLEPISQTFPIWWFWLSFLMLWEINEKTCISHLLKYTIRWESDGKKAPILCEKYDYWFPRLSPYHATCCIFPYCGKFMGNPCISHMMKYTIGWESNGKKAPILWEKYEYQFSRLSPYHGFYCIFPYCGKFMGKPKDFPNDGIGYFFPVKQTFQSLGFLKFLAWSRNPCSSKNMGNMNSHDTRKVWEKTNIPKLWFSQIFWVKQKSIQFPKYGKSESP